MQASILSTKVLNFYYFEKIKGCKLNGYEYSTVCSRQDYTKNPEKLLCSQKHLIKNPRFRVTCIHVNFLLFCITQKNKKNARPENHLARIIQELFLSPVLRIIVGWHFLYEGIIKLAVPEWSSYGYLAQSKWILSGFFHWIMNNPTSSAIADL